MSTTSQGTSPSTSQAIALALPITDVTVLEDRAHIVRSGRVQLPAGRCLLSLAQVSAVLSDKTAIMTAHGPAAVAVLALRLERFQVILEEDQPAALAALTVELRRLEDQRTRLSDLQSLAQTEVSQLEGVLTNTLTEIGQDVSYARDGASEWKTALDLLAERIRQAHLQVLGHAESLTQLEESIRDLAARIQAQSSLAGSIAARMTIEVETSQAGDYDLRLAYLVPGACWRPYHTARWQETVPPTIDLSCDACIWQNTGEDWSAVSLRCSTERASLGATPPLLESDLLTLKRKEAVLAVEVREQVVQTTGGEAGAPAQEVMGIDDGGETRLLTCQGAATIPSDGMPHRVPLFSCASPCEPATLVLGELTQAAITRTSQSNTATVPLLAGPVDLIRRGGLAGRTAILYVAAGERFDLGWGPDGDVRVQRSVQVLDEKPGLLTSWHSRLHVVDLFLSNLSDSPRTLAVSERIPVSSLEQVVIELDAAQTKPGASADAQGMVAWTVVLPPRGHAQVSLRYRLKKHPSVAGL
jgi:uncharacterized protein (TIGR02231 family)